MACKSSDWQCINPMGVAMFQQFLFRRTGAGWIGLMSHNLPMLVLHYGQSGSNKAKGPIHSSVENLSDLPVLSK